MASVVSLNGAICSQYGLNSGEASTYWIGQLLERLAIDG